MPAAVAGGAIRIVANTVMGNGRLSAVGGPGSSSSERNCWTSLQWGGDGSAGRIRIEANQISYGNSNNVPQPTLDVPGPLFLPGAPALKFVSVGGVAAPAAPSGNMDVTLPSTTANPITVVFETSGVPVGSTISLRVIPSYAAVITAQSGPTTGTTTSATASASVTIPTGHNVFQATVSYTVVASVGDELSRFARNEQVERVTLAATFGGQTTAKLITVSGKEYDVPAEVLRLAAAAR